MRDFLGRGEGLWILGVEGKRERERSVVGGGLFHNTFFQMLPRDVWRIIFQTLDMKSLGRCVRVCKQWMVMVGDDQALWSRYLSAKVDFSGLAYVKKPSLRSGSARIQCGRLVKSGKRVLHAMGPGAVGKTCLFETYYKVKLSSLYLSVCLIRQVICILVLPA
jgi:hypothetical protein